MIDVTSPAEVRITSSETTLSEIIFSIVPGTRFRMLVIGGVGVEGGNVVISLQ